MSVTQFSQLRDQARRLPAGGVTAVPQQTNPCPDSNFCVKQEEIVAIDAPDQAIKPGGTVDVEVTLRNWAGHILFTDPDACQNNAQCDGGGLFDYNGFCLEIEVDHPGGVEKQDFCDNRSAIKGEPTDVSFVFTAPTQPGDYDVTARFRMPASHQKGNTDWSGRVQDTITVSEEGQDRPGPGNGDGGGNGGGDGGLGERELFAGFALILVALFAVASLLP